MKGGCRCRYRGSVAGKRSSAVQAAHQRLRHRLEDQLRLVQAFVRAEEQVAAARERRKAVEAENDARLRAVQAENEARVGEADEALRARKAARAEALAALAVVVNDEDETAALVDVSAGEVRAARRAVPAERAREVAAKAGRSVGLATATGSGKPEAATGRK